MTKTLNSTTQTGSVSTVGWREWVNLPDIDVPWIKAKIDTGAATSSLHAHHIRVFERDGEEWVRFDVRPWQAAHDLHDTELPILDRRTVRSSSGHSEERVVVVLDLTMAGCTVSAQVTLTDRSDMGFRMLIGREALKQGFVVDVAHSYLGGKPPKHIRRFNRGGEEFMPKKSKKNKRKVPRIRKTRSLPHE